MGQVNFELLSDSCSLLTHTLHKLFKRRGSTNPMLLPTYAIRFRNVTHVLGTQRHYMSYGDLKVIGAPLTTPISQRVKLSMMLLINASQLVDSSCITLVFFPILVLVTIQLIRQQVWSGRFPQLGTNSMTYPTY